ncbi:MAG: argininosuccinate lyase [Acidobacteriaceae bacterium]
MAKMWAGRLAGTLNQQFERWQSSFSFDQRLLPQEVAASRAYARALAGSGILSSAETALILGGLDQIERTSILPIDDQEAEDVHHHVERRLAALIGDVALKLHTGRSRNEQIATDLRLYLRAHADEIVSALVSICAALIGQAVEVGTAFMPAYTHLQKAEPVLTAHFLLAYFEKLRRDVARLHDCVSRMNYSPLGSGPIAGGTISLDRNAMAAELGFIAPCRNSMDATSDRDFVLDYLNSLAQASLHLSSFSEQMIFFASQEVGFLRLPDSFATGSSAMPQKKNPDVFELIRAKSARILGCASSIAGIQKGLPLGYNKDLQEIQPVLFDACDCALQTFQIAAEVVAELEFDAAKMRAGATTGFLNAMAAATYLAAKGVPFRRAHEQIGLAVRACIAKGCELHDLTLEELRTFAPEADGATIAGLTVEAVIGLHDVAGGTAYARVAEALTEAQEWMRSRMEGRHACA